MLGIRRFFRNLGHRLSLSDKVYHPPEADYSHKKEMKVCITHLHRSSDLTEIRRRIEDCEVVFIGIGKTRRDELSHCITQIKGMARQKDRNLYGVDPRWVAVSKFKPEDV